MTAAPSPLSRLLAILDLEPVERDIFRGGSPREWRQRVFGGQVAGQALVAAGRTAPADRPVHSLHAYFLRPGDPEVPIVYLVDRIRDGRSFTTRRVVAVQHGEAIFHLSASFHRPETGLDHQVAMPAVPAPESLPTFADRLGRLGGDLPAVYHLPRPFDLRYLEDPPWQPSPTRRRPAEQMVWLRADGELPDDPLLHVCLLTYVSDMTLLDSALAAHGVAWPQVAGASLDHAMWFHRPFRADRWLLYAQESPSTAGARAFARGQIFSAEGALVASVVQEGLLRLPRPAG